MLKISQLNSNLCVSQPWTRYQRTKLNKSWSNKQFIIKVYCKTNIFSLSKPFSRLLNTSHTIFSRFTRNRVKSIYWRFFRVKTLGIFLLYILVVDNLFIKILVMAVIFMNIENIQQRCTVTHLNNDNGTSYQRVHLVNLNLNNDQLILSHLNSILY